TISSAGLTPNIQQLQCPGPKNPVPGATLDDNDIVQSQNPGGGQANAGSTVDLTVQLQDIPAKCA
ncbi:MAG TPA: hypothetical protein VNQ48_01425, partial [Microbacteriaceae bacterium]|nr:hypothetical protein [Microbacteriaceae bacterium]